MKLIYLDTSNFSLLTNTKNTEPQKYNKFIQKWKENNFTLAFSISHLDELLRLDIADSRSARFEILEDFLPFRFESDLTNKEILSAFMEKKVIMATFKEFQLFPKMFSQIIANPDDLAFLKIFNFDEYRKIINLEHKASEFSWKASTQSPPKSKNDKLFRLSDLPDNSITPEMIDSFGEIIDQIKMELPKNFSDIPISQLNIGIEYVSNIFKDFIEESNTSNIRKAFSDLIKVDSTDKKILKKPVNYLTDLFYFRLFLENFIENILEMRDSQEIRLLTSRISLEDCSGFWLSRQVKTQLELANDSAPSNEKDIKHIYHLP